MKTPYDRLHEASESGQLPPNLQIQKDAVRFTGKGDHRMDQVLFTRVSYIYIIDQSREISVCMFSVVC